MSPHETRILRAADTLVDESPDVRRTTLAGALLNDRYEIQGELGRGGIGVVYLALDRRVKDRPVVLKALLESSAQSEQAAWFRRHFEQEIEALARISHPGVVSVTDIGVFPDGKPFFVMQYVKGVSLRSVLKSTEQLTLSQCGTLVRQIGQALQAAHDQQVIHRDLKPENVMIQTDEQHEERVVLIDFGIASVGEAQPGSSVNITEKTEVAGSLPYMAPEQLKGLPVAASDTWALGVIAYEALTGRLPFGAPSIVELYHRQQAGNYSPPEQLRPDLPEAAASLLRSALVFDPALRPPRIREFSEALDAALRTPAVTVRGYDPMVAQYPSSSATQVATSPFLPEADKRPTPIPQPASRLGYWLAAVLGCALLAWGAWYLLHKPDTTISQTNDTKEETKPVAAQNVLSYSLSALNAAKPNSPPAELAGEVLFSGELLLRLNITAEKPGRLYLVDEGPELKRGMPHYIFLYPAPEVGSVALKPGQMIYLPNESIKEGFKVDAVAGAEKLWLIWSEQPLPLLENLRVWYEKNPQFPGEIADMKDVKSFQQFLLENATLAQPVTEIGTRQTQLKLPVAAKLLIHTIKIAHV